MHKIRLNVEFLYKTKVLSSAKWKELTLNSDHQPEKVTSIREYVQYKNMILYIAPGTFHSAKLLKKIRKAKKTEKL